MSRTILATALIFFTALQCVPAQFNTKFRLVAWKDGEPESLSYLQNGKLADIEGIQAGIRSDMQPYSGPSTINFFPAGATLSDDDKPKPLASVPIPSGVRFPLIILIPNPDGPSPPYRGIVFDDDPAAFPFPSYFLVNFTKQNVALSLGKQQFVMAPGKSKVITSKEKTLNLRMAVPKGGAPDQWTIIYDNFYPNWPEERCLLFVLDATRHGSPSLEVRSLLESEAVWKAALQTENKPE